MAREKSACQFSVEQYCKVNDISLTVFEDYLSALYGSRDDWLITVEAPDEHAPCGRLFISHVDFNNRRQVVIDNRRIHEGGIVYSVFNPMETDILTVAEDVSLETAVALAVDRANNDHEVMCPEVHNTPITQRIITCLTSAVTAFR